LSFKLWRLNNSKLAATVDGDVVLARVQLDRPRKHDVGAKPNGGRACLGKVRINRLPQDAPQVIFVVGKTVCALLALNYRRIRTHYHTSCRV
jgi:hypothetical protein